MYWRNITRKLQEARADTPAILLTGARQTGKTTLLRDLLFAPDAFPGRYVSLDDFTALAAARADPAGFLDTLGAAGEPVILDEIQLAPELLPALKLRIDRARRPGRFLLTGSANVLTLPRVSESLAGRVELQTLWPLSQAEIEGRAGSLVDWLFSDASPATLPALGQGIARAELAERVLRGGYPEAVARAESRRQEWFASYLTTILQRDVRDLAQIEGLTQMPRLLGLLASRIGTLLNLADLSRTMPLPYTTLQRYLTLLEAIFLVRPLPAWSDNRGSRLLKTPKTLLCDTGLAGHLLGVSVARLVEDPNLLGGLLENFVAMELRKDAGGSRTSPSLFHWHTVQGQEVDVVLEARDGRLVGVEVKAAATLSGEAFRGLRAFGSSVGERLHRGIVFYSGEHILPFGDRLFALPLSVLWSPLGKEE